MNHSERIPTSFENEVRINAIFTRAMNEIRQYTNAHSQSTESQSEFEQAVKEMIMLFLEMKPQLENEVISNAVEELVFGALSMKVAAKDNKQPEARLN